MIFGVSERGWGKEGIVDASQSINFIFTIFCINPIASLSHPPLHKTITGILTGILSYKYIKIVVFFFVFSQGSLKLSLLTTRGGQMVKLCLTVGFTWPALPSLPYSPLLSPSFSFLSVVMWLKEGIYLFPQDLHVLAEYSGTKPHAQPRELFFLFLFPFFLLRQSRYVTAM